VVITEPVKRIVQQWLDEVREQIRAEPWLATVELLEVMALAQKFVDD
jgi:hypothetical protein